MKDRAVASAAQMHGPAEGHSAYRPDIDGLRALSVIVVILFHAGIPGFTGGFVGVDVFFVVSGFLITRLLLDRPAQPLWTRLRQFYLRRARRILPALFVVVWASALGAWLLFAPVELVGFGHFVAACAAMLANVAAWNSGGYFDTPWATTPLLHLWSIAVEEQFYLLFPLLFIFVQRRVAARWRAPLIGAAALASFAACVWASYAHPSANYYAAPTRAWELLLGSLLALGAVPVPGRRLIRDLVAGLALAALIAACLVFDSRTRYPGLYTLAPALATAALIVTAGAPSNVNRALTFGPLVFVGLISYSLYLWHVPVLTLFGYYNIVPVTVPQKIALLAAIGVLAAASWRFVEQPVRARQLIHDNTAFACIAVGCSAVTLAGGLVVARSDGYFARFPPDVQRIFEPAKLFATSGTPCMGLSLMGIEAGALCRSGVPQSTSRILLWGDSHAWALLPAVEHIATQRGAQVLFAAWPGCHPLVGMDGEKPGEFMQAHCAAFNAAMLRAAKRVRPDYIVLDAYWTLTAYPVSDANGIARALVALAQQVGEGTRICVVHGAPLYPFSIPNAMATARRRGIDAAAFMLPRATALRQQASFDAAFHEVAAGGMVRAFDPKSVLCASATCRFQTADGLPLYRDSNHLSVTGALELAPALDKCLR
jgi:peptidoglycan/LPS O-acetylase OafA/YrhL